MTQQPSPAPALVCVMAAIPAAERPAHAALSALLFRERVLDKRALENGYAFRFPSEMLESLACFVAAERKCCSFLEFEITVQAGDGPARLQMTGPPGTREFLDAEFATLDRPPAER